MKNRHLSAIIAGVLLGLGLSSCSETSDDNSEFDNWKERNEAYFQSKYNEAKASASATTYVLPKWSLNDSIATSPDNYIIVQVVEQGSGTECPMYTDSVRVHFRGRTIPTSASPDGYIVGSSYEGTFYEATALPRMLSLSGSSTTDGLATALQRMHIGDRWTVCIPYQLAFGTAAYTPSSTTEWLSASIPAYSTLIYDVKLVGIKHPGGK